MDKKLDWLLSQFSCKGVKPPPDFAADTLLTLVVANSISRIGRAWGIPARPGRFPGLMATPVSTRRSEGRSERRIVKRLAAELARPDESVPEEMTFTEN